MVDRGDYAPCDCSTLEERSLELPCAGCEERNAAAQEARELPDEACVLYLSRDIVGT